VKLCLLLLLNSAQTKHLETKRPLGQNVRTNKTSVGQNVRGDKMSGNITSSGQNVRGDKTSKGTKRSWTKRSESYFTGPTMKEKSPYTHALSLVLFFEVRYIYPNSLPYILKGTVRQKPRWVKSGINR
jgi:hypothetical protein